MIERETRPVFIHMLTMEHREGDQVQFTVRCSKGTYVRTLAEDIGRALGCGAHLIGLRRIAIAQFSIEHACSFDQLELMDSTQRDAKVLPLDALVQDLPRLDLDEQQTIRFAQGQKLGMELPLALGKYRLYSSERFIGVGEWLGYGLAPSRLLGSLAKSAANSDST
jgi:tRNA pseudouridine55 synthase